MTLLINGVHSYTSLSSEFLTADVLAHEMTHAETHQRIYQNSTDTSSIPIWFDEGWLCRTTTASRTAMKPG